MSSQSQQSQHQSYYLKGGTGGVQSISQQKNSLLQILRKDYDVNDRSQGTVKFMEKRRTAGQNSDNLKNSYVSNTTEGFEKSSIMTSGDIQVQRQTLSQSKIQSSQMQKFYRQNREGLSLASSNSQSHLAHRKLESFNLSSPCSASQQNAKQNTSILFKTQNQKCQNDKQSSTLSQTFSLSTLHQRYYQQVKTNSLFTTKFLDKGCFEGLVHNFAINDIILMGEHSNKEIQTENQLFPTEVIGEKANHSLILDESSHYQYQPDKLVEKKEELVVLMLDLMREIEEPFKETFASTLFPRMQMIKIIMEGLAKISNKACIYLVNINEEPIGCFINGILKIIAKIFQRYDERVKEQVMSKVEMEIKNSNQQMQYLKKQNDELQERISEITKEQVKQKNEFKEKIVKLEDEKNQQVELAEMLNEQLSDLRKKQYKDFQIDSISSSSKELSKQYAILEAELLKNKINADESLMVIAKLASNRIGDNNQENVRPKNLSQFYQNPMTPSKGNSMLQSNNSFSESTATLFAEKYQNPLNKAGFLFSHPFKFSLEPDISTCLYDRMVPKMARSQIAVYLESFLDHETQLKNEGTRLSAPSNFVSQIPSCFTYLSPSDIQFTKKVLHEEKDFFRSTIKIQEVCQQIQNSISIQKQFGLFYSTLFGIYQEHMLTDNQFEIILAIRNSLKKSTPSLQNISQLTEVQQQKLFEDEIFIPSKLLYDSFCSQLKYHPNFKRLEEKLQMFIKTKRMQISAKAVQEQKSVNTSSLLHGSSSLVLIPNIMEKLKTENINDVMRSLDNIFEKLDVKNNGKASYQSFKKLMKNHFGIDTENESFSEYFQPFKENDNFDYPSFMNKVILLHLPEQLNDKLIPFYCAMNEISNIMIQIQNQSFHDFKNKLSNILFSQDSHSCFSFSLIEEFFDQYESSKENPLQYNVKKISPAMLYQSLFLKNEWISLYNLFKQRSKIDVSSDQKLFQNLYQREELINNFNQYMDYINHIFSFLMITEKILVKQVAAEAIPLIPLLSMNSKQSSSQLLNQKQVMSKLKTLSTFKKKETSNLSVKKSHFLGQEQSNISGQSMLDLNDSVTTPQSAITKKSLFSGF